jgi:hypothetical protein
MPRKQGSVQNDVSEAPVQPQYQLGATASEAAMATQVASNPLQGPGGIVDRLGQQFQIPRAQPDTSDDRFHTNPATLS